MSTIDTTAALAEAYRLLQRCTIDRRLTRATRRQLESAATVIATLRTRAEAEIKSEIS